MRPRASARTQFLIRSVQATDRLRILDDQRDLAPELQAECRERHAPDQGALLVDDDQLAVGFEGPRPRGADHRHRHALRAPVAQHRHQIRIRELVVQDVDAAARPGDERVDTRPRLLRPDDESPAEPAAQRRWPAGRVGVEQVDQAPYDGLVVRDDHGVPCTSKALSRGVEGRHHGGSVVGDQVFRVVLHHGIGKPVDGCAHRREGLGEVLEVPAAAPRPPGQQHMHGHATLERTSERIEDPEVVAAEQRQDQSPLRVLDHAEHGGPTLGRLEHEQVAAVILSRASAPTRRHA